MKFNFVSRTVVYEYADLSGEGGLPGSADGDGWQLASTRGIESVFRDDPIRSERFQRYLNARHTGLLLVRGGKWVCYGWCSNPQSASPPHLPQWVASLGAYWIFGCHTRESFRCQGLYKQMLTRLIDLALRKGIPARLYIDTHPENIPSRRAILATAFKPCGLFYTYRLWSPVGRTRILGGRWRVDEPHAYLDLALGTANVPVPAISAGVPYKNYAG